MVDKIKKFLKDLIQGTFAICLLAVVLYLLSTPIDFDGGAESDTTEMTSYTHVLYDIRICKSITGNLKLSKIRKLFSYVEFTF